ncbi:transglycosylase domain-containing protein [Sphingomonas corticis]|uniref:peptidoglycan glycosyltransferase n=1 Tax=Sphingomonas corticis TaxID=2722791 RepID=A0ABX1CNT3_9SPHN|nr:transglycosylase domain-containing protein [Sphingomonas corticis]NJR79602.1 penicillin-binding protein [Sphingomonas corticis]
MNPPYDSGRVRYNHGPGQPAAGQTPAPPATPLPSFDPWREPAPEPPRYDRPPEELGGGGEPPRRRFPFGKWIVRGLAALLVLFFVAVAWLAVTAPLSQSLKPPTPPSITLTDSQGKPIARRGAVIGAPVDAATLPPHVREAFLAIEDRRFYSHWGIDPRGIARAAWANVGSGGVRQGGSTITQQLAKNAFLDSDRTAARKLREVLIAFWLEAWLTKDEILSRYLSNVYFGDNVYGMTAAAKHYFGRTPDRLNVGQAAMLAGLVKAPSRLAPTGNLKGARARQAVVVAAMVDAGFLTRREADAVQPQRVLPLAAKAVPSGTYFADWVLPEARDQAGEIRDEATVRTTLDAGLQATAERIVRQAGLRKAQAAIVAMKTSGEVVAMVGGRDYKASPFNRATQAKRQPGSTFKLFVYLAAMRAGMEPASTVDDSPIEIAGWKPKNDDGRYQGEISLATAFARSSNVAAARLTQQVGVRNVIRAARDLGISTPIANEATIGLGTSEVTLLELTAAYAAIANGSYPVQPRGLASPKNKSWYQSLSGGQTRMAEGVRTNMLSLLNSSIRGTGRAANLPMMAYGKTGTSQQGRDAWFIGFAGDLVVGVWVGNDDNSPNPGLHGGGIPAQMWRQFMASALNIPDPEPEPELIEAGEDQDAGNATLEFGLPEELLERSGEAIDQVNERLERLGVGTRVNPDGSIDIGPSRRDSPPRDRRDDRRPPDDEPPGPDEF